MSGSDPIVQEGRQEVMKRWVNSLLVFAAFCVILFTLRAEAASEEEHTTLISGNFEYYINDEDTVTISRWNGDEETLDIPEEIDGHRVACLGYGAFAGRPDLTHIGIPETITRIEDYAFIYCTGLSSIEIPKSVKFIGEGAFSGCLNLSALSVSYDNVVYYDVDNVLFNKL